MLPLVALVAGLVSFSSPCCLPLVPGYLSYVSALPVADLGTRQARRLTVRAAVLFVLGFTVVFTGLGLTASVLGSLLLEHQRGLVVAAGVLMVVLGLASAGVLRLPFLLRERRVDLARLPRGPAFAFPLGMAFAAGWTPCIGPVLGTILTAAAVKGSLAWGGILLALYSLGLGIPFVLLAVGYRRATASMSFLRRHGRRLEQLGGALLVVVGVLFVTGRWQVLFRPLQRIFARWGWPPI